MRNGFVDFIIVNCNLIVVVEIKIDEKYVGNERIGLGKWILWVDINYGSLDRVFLRERWERVCFINGYIELWLLRELCE